VEWLLRLSAWWYVATYAAFWIGIALLVRSVLRRSLTRLASHRRDELSDVLAKTLPRPAAVAVLLFALGTGLRILPLGDKRMVEAHKLVGLALAVLGVVVLLRVCVRSIDAYGSSRPELKSSSGVGKGAAWIVGLGLIAALVCDAFGISLAPVLTALGVGSLAVALALQDTLSNFFSGVYLVVDRPVRPGDFIRVDPTYEGYVEAIGWRSTHLRTLSNNLVIIPNATLSKAIITNYTLPTPNVATSVRVDVPFGADLDKIEDALADEANRSLDVPGMSDAPAPSVAMAPGFVDGGVAFTVSFFVRSFADQGPVQNVVRKRIAARLKKEGVTPVVPRT
jgi:small-conductance mechanosensitive channel